MPSRPVIRHRGTAIVLIKLPNHQFLLVRQWRPVVNHWTIEAPGGMIDGSESPESAAVRETMEELGIAIPEPQILGSFFLGLGYSDEIIHAFATSLDTVPPVSPESGISPVFMSMSELCQQPTVLDGKTLAALLLLGMHADEASQAR
jgi:ADP-ribose pyrophosphatase